MGKTSRPISFPYNRDKATQAILWLLNRSGGAMDKLRLIKLFFFADREHLACYGRPIVGGTYYAMDYGPVSSELKKTVDVVATSDNPYFFIRPNHNVVAKQAPNEDQLSESDLDVLERTYNEYGHIGSFKLSELTHKLKVYIKNKPPEGGRKLIPYEDFFLDLKDDGVLELIREHQAAIGHI